MTSTGNCHTDTLTTTPVDPHEPSVSENIPPTLTSSMINSCDPHLLSNQTASDEPTLKRARHYTPTNLNTNGFTDSPTTLSYLSPVSRFPPGSSFDCLRVAFDKKVKLNLLQNLEKHMNRLFHAEVSVKSLRSDMKEIRSRMEHINTTSEELKKLVKERVSLPAPTSGIGDRRAISSQAPRLPQQTLSSSTATPSAPSPSGVTTVPASNTLIKSVPTTTSLSKSATTAIPTTSYTSVTAAPLASLVSNNGPLPPKMPPGNIPTSPSAASATVCDPLPRTVPLPVCPASTNISSSIPTTSIPSSKAPAPRTCSVSIPLSSAPTNTNAIHNALETSKPIQRLPVASKSPLFVRPSDTIDLTADNSPPASIVECATPTGTGTINNIPNRTASNQVSGGRMATKNPLNSTASATMNRPAYQTGPRFPSQTASNMLNSSKLSRYPCQPGPPMMNRAPCQAIFSPQQLSYRELQLLPVAPLPPCPMQPPLHCPVQPTPQLTIAEATEGVCLQWTVGYHSMPYEMATSYEVYSYASSELTVETLQTCLPWKKVGEVAALPLPMACTLTHVQSNNMYYFIVRSIDRFHRYSSWSNVVNAYVA